MKYQITITTIYPEAYSRLFSLVVNSGYKANITAGPIDSDTDPVLPSADTPAPAPAPAEEPANKDRISEIASLAVPPGLPAELSKATPAKVKDLKEFLSRYCTYDDTQHTIPQEMLKALASVIDDRAKLLAYLRDDGKLNKEFKQIFNLWKKSLKIHQNIKISLGG